ncbi:hypothetical protein [Spirosoma aerolatum]|uniref:hypothetical protein n=1 Tax=Spirosoma aerolatum TaxID=1211326 RepID=UPI0009AEA246|nr:hypothetical protein [Spirosoma aerolatum]
MDKRLFLSLAVLASLQIGCQSRVDEPVQPEQQLASATTRQSSDSLTPDSIAAYRPAFGDANTVRQFPYTNANQHNTALRLTRVLYNGRPIRNYLYSDQGRLAERTDYYTDGTHIYKKFTYSYEAGKPTKIVSEINKEVNTLTSYPRNNDLRPSTVTTLADSAGWIQKTTAIEFLDGYQKPGTTVSRLGFSTTGLLIWDEKTDQKGILSQYTLYRRDESGNVILRRMGLLNNRWEAVRYNYDQNPNPFRTTGDIQPLDFGDLNGLDLVAVNNIVTATSTNSEGSRIQWQYVYTYRSDGYPSRVAIYRDERQVSTVEFVYNQ